MSTHIDEYRAAVTTAATAAVLLRLHDLPALLAAIQRAHAMGPILDPTLYRDNAAAMDRDKELLEAALPLWRLGARFEQTGATP